MIHIGLTGNVASGKSTVGRIWADEGIPVVSADELAREVVAPGGLGHAQIRQLFGDESFRPDGSLNRDRMRELAFRDSGARKQLEEVIHPHIHALRERWLKAQRVDGSPLVVSEIPLLFEAKLEGLFDAIVVVDALQDVREDRLVLKRGISRLQSRQMLAAQGDPETKLARAHYVIRNDRTLSDLEVSSLEVLAQLRRLKQKEDSE